MRFFTIQKLVLFIVSCFLTGCILEEPDDCEDQSTVLETRLYFQCLSDSIDFFDQEIANILIPSQVSGVNMYVYDWSTGNLIKEQSVSKNALSQFQGISLALEPGTYEIRCWANAGRQTVIHGESRLTTARITNVQNYPNQQTVTSDDPLFYGATTLTVPQNGFIPDVIADTIRFKAAHMRISLMFSGKTKIVPEVEILNLNPVFDFEMDVVEDNFISYFPIINRVDDTTHISMSSTFNILRTAYRYGNINYDYTKDIEINVKDPVADTLIYSVILYKWMLSKGIDLFPEEENDFLSIPDSLLPVTTGFTMLPPIHIILPDSNTTIPTDTIPVDTIPVPPHVPDVNEQGLYFHLYSNNNDVFARDIQSVNLFVYEKLSGDFVPISKNVLTKSDLNQFQGLKMSLPPINSSSTATREYEICCWANVGANTLIADHYQFSSAVLYHTGLFNSGTIATHDNLYFSRSTVKVTPEYTYVTANLNFKPAFTQFLIIVKGMNSSHSIRVSGLPNAFDFNMNNRLLSTKDYYPKGLGSSSESTYIFNSLRLTNQNKDNVKITLLDANGFRVHEVLLSEKDIRIDNHKDNNYIFVKGVSTANRITVLINVGDQVNDDVW